MTNNNKTSLIGAVTVFIVIIAAVTILLVFDKDPASIIALSVGTLVPSILALSARTQASKAKDAAETAVHNTNGRMTELIRVIASNGLPIPEGYDDVTIPEVTNE